MTTTRENVFEMQGQAGVTISFYFDNEYIVTKGQTLERVESEGNCIVKIDAGRSASRKCAEWFSSHVSDDETKMIHTKSRGNNPKDLNFAIKGVLNINGDKFDVCFGQGHQNSIGNNWHFCSPSIIADKNGKNGYLSDKYYFAQDGTHKFIVTLKK
ncbi:TPA: hypothetical protein I7122_05505 [Vibrio vulnificus]|nr:hypothetical protein [Vibrio vulnificus]